MKKKNKTMNNKYFKDQEVRFISELGPNSHDVYGTIVDVAWVESYKAIVYTVQTGDGKLRNIPESWILSSDDRDNYIVDD